jgi:hypothetical protein
MTFELGDWQVAEIERYKEPYRAILWSPRLRKTATTIKIAEKLYIEGLIDSVVVVAPNGVYLNWSENELPKHAKTDYEIYKWVQSDKNKITDFYEKIKTPEKLQYYLYPSHAMINSNIKEMFKTLNTSGRRYLLVVDESHDFRNASSIKTKNIIIFARGAAYKRILTGTPISKSPINAFSQFQILKEGCLGFKNITAFSAEYVIKEYRENKSKTKSFPVITGYRNIDLFQKSIAPFSSVIIRKVTNIDTETVKFSLTEDEKRVYKEVLKTFSFNAQGENYNLNLNATKRIKLQQAGSGFVIDKNGVIAHINKGSPSRLEAFKKVFLAEADKRVIVWAHFKEDFKIITKWLKSIGITPITFNGDSTDAEREKCRQIFNAVSTEENGVILAHRVSAGAGIDMSRADVMIEYSYTENIFASEQALARASSLDRDTVKVYRLTCGGVDDAILNNLSGQAEREIETLRDLAL